VAAKLWPIKARYAADVAATGRGCTPRQRTGDRGEALAARYLASLGWLLLGSKIRAGPDELDLVALDPGPVETLVFVEVRSNVSDRFGSPEESVAGRKLRRTYRAALALLREGRLANGVHLPEVAWRVDVIIVEHRPTLGRGQGGPVLRHLRGVTPD
jgi:putative endonuclease